MTPIRIVLADDHGVVRAGLRLLLDDDPDFEVVAEAADVDGALRAVLGHKPDVLVLDLNMPGEQSSLEALPGVAERSPDTKTVILTMQEDPEYARRALRAGALGYVLKEAADAELVEAVRRAAAGGTYLNPALGARLATTPEHAGRPAGQPVRARGRGPAADRARPHERRDRRAAVPLGPDRRDPPRAHPAEARPVDSRRARALRAGPRAA